jgi:hypothetical protein
VESAFPETTLESSHESQEGIKAHYAPVTAPAKYGRHLDLGLSAIQLPRRVGPPEAGEKTQGKAVVEHRKGDIRTLDSLFSREGGVVEATFQCPAPEGITPGGCLTVELQTDSTGCELGPALDQQKKEIVKAAARGTNHWGGSATNHIV